MFDLFKKNKNLEKKVLSIEEEIDNLSFPKQLRKKFRLNVGNIIYIPNYSKFRLNKAIDYKLEHSIIVFLSKQLSIKSVLLENSGINLNFFKSFQELELAGLKYIDKMLDLYHLEKRYNTEYYFILSSEELLKLLATELYKIINLSDKLYKEYTAYLVNEINHEISSGYSFFDKPTYVFTFNLKRKDFDSKINLLKQCLSDNSTENVLFNRIISFIKSKESDFLLLEKGLNYSADDKQLQTDLLSKQDILISDVYSIYNFYVRYTFNGKSSEDLSNLNNFIQS